MQNDPIVIDRNLLVEEEQEIPSSAIVETTIIDDLMVAANEKIATMIEEAKAQTERCLSEANQQAELTKQQAYDTGHQEGYQQGYNEGMLKGKEAILAEMQQTIDQTNEKNHQSILDTKEEIKKMMLDAERQIVDIALAVARKILAYEISENPMVVLPLVKTALAKVCDQEEVVIRVSVDDLDAVLLAKNDLQTMVGREQALKIIVDSTITGGSCIIDTSYGTVDARIDTQFENIKKALQGVA